MIKLDLLIVGAGGNGQSYFMNFLKKNKIKINSINDKDIRINELELLLEKKNKKYDDFINEINKNENNNKDKTIKELEYQIKDLQNYWQTENHKLIHNNYQLNEQVNQLQYDLHCFSRTLSIAQKY